MILQSHYIAVSSTALCETMQRTGANLKTGATCSCSSMRGVSFHFARSDWSIRWVLEGSVGDLVY
jgi:hypothetical protein